MTSESSSFFSLSCSLRLCSPLSLLSRRCVSPSKERVCSSDRPGRAVEEAGCRRRASLARQRTQPSCRKGQARVHGTQSRAQKCDELASCTGTMHRELTPHLCPSYLLLPVEPPSAFFRLPSVSCPSRQHRVRHLSGLALLLVFVLLTLLLRRDEGAQAAAAHLGRHLRIGRDHHRIGRCSRIRVVRNRFGRCRRTRRESHLRLRCRHLGWRRPLPGLPPQHPVLRARLRRADPSALLPRVEAAGRSFSGSPLEDQALPLVSRVRIRLQEVQTRQLEQASHLDQRPTRLRHVGHGG